MLEHIEDNLFDDAIDDDDILAVRDSISIIRAELSKIRALPVNFAFEAFTKHLLGVEDAIKDSSIDDLITRSERDELLRDMEEERLYGLELSSPNYCQ